MEKRLSPISKVHIRTTRDQLRSLKKESDKPIAYYFLHAKTLVDSLVVTRSPISDSNLIEFVIDGFGHTYKEIVISLQVHPVTSFDELYDLAIQEENLLQRISSLIVSIGMAHIANHTSTTTITLRGDLPISSKR